MSRKHKLTEEEKRQRQRLADRLKDRILPANWSDDVGAPHYPEDRNTGEPTR